METLQTIVSLPYVREIVSFAGFLLFCAALIWLIRVFFWVIGDRD